jgi:hypothetical protein
MWAQEQENRKALRKYALQDRNSSMNIAKVCIKVTPLRVRVMFIPPRLFQQPDAISLGQRCNGDLMLLATKRT